MIADDLIAKRVYDQNIEFFAALAPTVQLLGVGPGEPFLELDGSFAFFAGEGSPLTQASGSLTAEHLLRIAEFYDGRATSWEAILTPFAGPGAVQRVIDLDAEALGWESSLIRSLDEPLPDWPAAAEIAVVEVGPSELDRWSDVATRGFFGDEPSEAGKTLARIIEQTNVVRRYLAYWNDEPAGAATLTPGREISFLGGMATLPPYRKKGIQMALLRRRLEDAHQYGTIATMGAEPGTSSHRNAIRVGFEVSYSQLSFRVPVKVA